MTSIMIFDFPLGWYLLLGFSVLLLAVFSYIRKSLSGVVKFGFIGLAISIVSEAAGVGLNLWNYTDGNWPVILWLIYFVFTAAFYQMFKVLDSRFQ